MHLIYLDEIKYNGETQMHEWLCGLAFCETVLLEVESKLSEIAEGFFGNPILKKETEFHGKEIVHRKGSFKDHEIGPRLDLFRQLLQVIEIYPTKILKIRIRIDPEYVVCKKDQYSDDAFMFFVECSDNLMKAQKSLGLLIADKDEEKATGNVHNLSCFRNYSTNYELSREINFLVDTIHHTSSHHSRFIQLADIYTYASCIASKEQEKHFQKNIYNYMHQSEVLKYANASKYWPTSQSYWYQQYGRTSNEK